MIKTWSLRSFAFGWIVGAILTPHEHLTGTAINNAALMAGHGLPFALLAYAVARLFFYMMKHIQREPAHPSHYDTLGVRHDAPSVVIKAAYKALSQKHHPDRGGSEAEMRKINEAYDAITNGDQAAGLTMAVPKINSDNIGLIALPLLLWWWGVELVYLPIIAILLLLAAFIGAAIESDDKNEKNLFINLSYGSLAILSAYSLFVFY